MYGGFATSGALTVLSAGSCEITVTAAGTANWNEATASFTDDGGGVGQPTRSLDRFRMYRTVTTAPRRSRIQFDLSENPGGMSWRTVKDHLFDVSGGAIERVQRVQPNRQREEPTVATQRSCRQVNDDVTLTLRGTSACTDTHAVCTSDRRAP